MCVCVFVCVCLCVSLRVCVCVCVKVKQAGFYTCVMSLCQIGFDRKKCPDTEKFISNIEKNIIFLICSYD